MQVAGRPAKPAREIHPDAMLHLKTPGGDFEVRVLALSEMRGPAAVAQTLFEETEASRDARLKASAEKRLIWEPEALRDGRPSKRDRRDLERLKGGQ